MANRVDPNQIVWQFDQVLLCLVKPIFLDSREDKLSHDFMSGSGIMPCNKIDLHIS